ncbi:MAG: formate dehydrogenase accessory sulfurtransferase FdhD [Gammaproteobacteria bacterium]|nr:formate dehydrogenase accessory sulfurtransferase FdhD [Gammaproteobacteria bacterium]NNF67431.1 formate dehydrogenase accessory sulfurtransferase FdhD [Gammaproteobacteria bacterium]
MIRSKSLAIAKVQGASRFDCPDSVAIEEPLEIRLGYATDSGRTSRSISITMRTPGDDVALALGFLYGESIINSHADVISASHCGLPAPENGLQNVVRVELADSATVDLARLERNFYTTSSCGVCGKSSLEALAFHGVSSLAEDRTQFASNMLSGLPEALAAKQVVFGETGGLHAAGLFTADGSIRLVREDVGRHNAVDKVIGELLRQDALPASACGLLVSGRASFELMQKAVRAGIPLLAAVGAPSSLAIAVAEKFDMTLIGFLRDNRFNIYTGEHRININETAN